MVPSKPVELKIYRGVTLDDIIFECKNNGVAVDLTGCTPIIKARSLNDPSVLVDLEPSLVVPATDGKVKLGKTDEETLDFIVDEYSWDFLITFPGGIKRGPYAWGTLKIANSPSASDE